MQNRRQTSIDNVAYNKGKWSTWGFVLAGDATKVSEVHDEILLTTEMVLQTCQGFFLTTSVKYNLLVYSADYSINKVFGDEIKPIDTIKREIRSDDGISPEEIISNSQCIVTQKNAVRGIWNVNVSGKTKIKLERIDAYVDKNSKLYWTEFEETFDKPPLHDPIEIEIVYDMNKAGKSESLTKANYEVVFWTYTDIWFKNTQVSVENAERLKEIFRKLNSNFKIVETSVCSDRFKDTELEQFLPPNK